MLFMIRCVDKPDHQHLRKQNREAHLAYLRDQGDALKLAGPTTDDGGQPTGSLLILEAHDRGAAEAFAAGDPYNKAGLFERVEIEPFKWVLPG